MLNVYMQDEEIVQNGDDTDDSHRIETTIFEASGLDRTGLVADVMQLLTRHDCDVRSAAVWTYKGRVAFVLSVTEKGRPIIESIKLDNLNQLIYRIMESPGSTTIVRAQKVRGEVHHDRRLHQLMLQDEMRGWMDSNNSKQILSSESEALQNGPDVKTTASSNLKVNDSAAELDHLLDYRSPKFDQPIIDISHCSYPNYWTINIKCKDRTKLLFDTVCTLADMEYDIYHATIDASSEGVASQEYFVRPRLGDADFNGNDAELLKAMLDSSIQRRFPKGLKVHVRSSDRFGCLASLARQLQVAGLSISRAKVRTFATSNSCGHTLYVMNSDGAMPDKRRVEQVLIDSGGRMADLNSFATSSATCDDARFDFTFLERQQGMLFKLIGECTMFAPLENLLIIS